MDELGCDVSVIYPSTGLAFFQARGSLSRVEASEEFKEIRVKVMERRKAGSLMRLADILKEQNNGTSNKDEDADPAEEDGDIAESDGGKVKTTPELREAVRVLADLVVLTDPSTLASRTP